MIYSILILLILLSLLYPIDCFYITNAVVIEQCSSTSIVSINKFDSTKMHCFAQTWRQVFIFLQYSCFQNSVTRLWTLQTTANKNANWPQEIYVFTGTQDYTLFNKFFPNDDPTIEENTDQFDPNNNQLTTYLWTSLDNGPQCRMRYTIVKDICTKNNQALGAKLSDALCYYGSQKFNLKTPDQRQALDKLLDNSMQTGQNNPSNTNNGTNSQQHSHLSPLAVLNSPFWQKNKRYIIIAGASILVILLIAIILLILRQRQSSNQDIDRQISENSEFE